MVDNFLYEIEHYGTILNANRTYFLSRSQPPFLTRMILGVYEQTRDRDVAAPRRWPAIEKYYAFWTTEPPPGARRPGLSRYYDLGDGPGARGGERREGRRRGAPTTTGRASTTGRTPGHRLRRRALLRPRRRTS